MIANRIKFLDGIRFILALWVVIGHFYTLIGGFKYHQFSGPVEKFLTLPIIAVYGFMIITGFLMMHNYILRAGKEPVDKKSTYTKFWLRRFFRLYPLYILIIAVAYFSFTYCALLAEKNLIFFTGSNVATAEYVRSTAQPSTIDLLLHVFLLHGFLPQFSDSLLGITWSLSLEMQFYAIFPFLFLLFFRSQDIQKKRLFVLIFIASALLFVLPKLVRGILTASHLNDFHEPSPLIFVMPFFLLGMVIAGVKSNKINVIYLIASLCLVMLCADIITNSMVILLVLFFFLDDLKSAVPKFIFKFLSGIDSLLSGKVAEFGANISYSLYLIHTLIIPVVVSFVISKSQAFHLSKNQIILISFIAVLIICFVVCHLLYLYIEKPFIKLGKKLINKIKTEETSSAPAVVS